MTATVPEQAAQALSVSKLRGEIINFGSSWAALCLCIQAQPVNLEELLLKAGVRELTGGRQLQAFNACADGYSVFEDARARHKL